MSIKHNDNGKLQIALSCAVPLHIQKIKAEGGITGEDVRWCGRISELIGEHGDILLWKGTKKNNYQDLFPGQKNISTADVFNVMAKAIAIQSFCPGGIKIFGMEFES